MEKITGKPKFMKELNILSIKRVILENPLVTRLDISKLTNISLTTVGSILTELLEKEEILAGGYDKSSGGRRAEKYIFNLEKYFSLGFCIENNHIDYIISDISGRNIKTGNIKVEKEDVLGTLGNFIEKLKSEKNIKSIALGVPGIVKTGGYIVNDENRNWIESNIGEFLENRFHIPVVLENDLNSTVLGFSMNYIDENKETKLENLNSIYIKFTKHCTGAGIITNGTLVHGKNNFAGEFGFIPIDGMKSLDEVINEQCSEKEYINALVKLILLLNYTINPEFIIVGGENFRENFWENILNECKKYIPEDNFPEIKFEKDNSKDYFRGISFLGTQLMYKNMGL